MNIPRGIISKDQTTIADVKVVELQAIFETDGHLVVGEWIKHFPFQPKRFFIISEVPQDDVRGNHAHRSQHQFLVPLHGTCCLLLDDGKASKDLVLNRPDIGVYIPPLIWVRYTCSVQTELLVLASDLYEPEDYVEDFDEFMGLKKGK
jgi:UDP-2-acetamido-3-amino-2,3-dideoxy-glucuronate N-acetyltransferase